MRTTSTITLYALFRPRYSLFRSELGLFEIRKNIMENEAFGANVPSFVLFSNPIFELCENVAVSGRGL